MLKHTILVAAVAGLVLAMAGTANAALITVDDVQSKATGWLGAGSATMFTAYDASGSDKLVVVASGENKNGGPSTVTAITYGGVPLTQAVQYTSTGRGQAAIFYLVPRADRPHYFAAHRHLPEVRGQHLRRQTKRSARLFNTAFG